MIRYVKISTFVSTICGVFSLYFEASREQVSLIIYELFAGQRIYTIRNCDFNWEFA